ncbi:response regulator [Alteriqipengyuania sp. WL0013]|uniref:response regulator n=1 Tax=Alteriqipengyuania sp. WL0013 TaxID=3110773 RepID=UPI002D187A93|nr:response regulator [Alteriqipengyuania sp. WL0013]MEB3416689.1 response regulator [Alteriqipengyuania sp. WL0013]
MRRTKPADQPALSGLKRVLVVEDDPILGAAIEATLEDAGVEEVIVLPELQSSLAAIEARKPDAIVLDIHLSDRSDGWALAELVQVIGPKPPRIVFQTGLPESIPPEIAELGPVLEKPYDPAELVEALRLPVNKSLLARIKGALA